MRAEEKRDKRIAKLNSIRGQLGIGATQFGQTKLEDLSAEGLGVQERFAKIMKRLGLKGATSPEDINKAASRKGIGLSQKDAELILRASEQLKNEEAKMLEDHFKQLAADIEKADKEERAKKQARDIAESKNALKNIEDKIDKLGAVV
jgi:superfamily I DNA/RNA helicase